MLGGVALVWLVALVVVRARRIARRDALRPEFAAVMPRPELLGAAAGAVLMSALFYEVLHFRHVWALFGLIAAVELWGRRPSRASGTGGRWPAIPEPAGGEPDEPPAGAAAGCAGCWPATSRPGWSRWPRSGWPPCWSPASAGPTLVGGFTLLRVLPGLAGVLACAGPARRRAVLPGRRGTARPAGPGRAGAAHGRRRDAGRGRLAGADPGPAPGVLRHLAGRR